MLDWIQNFLVSLWDIIQSVYGLISQLLQGLYDLIKYIPLVVSLVTSSIGFLPGVLLVFASLSITVSIIYLLAGRGQGG